MVQRSVAAASPSILRIVPVQRRESAGSVIQPQLGDFASDARTAITVAPDYFVRWYTIKSIGLGVAFAGLAFMLGRASVKGWK